MKLKFGAKGGSRDASAAQIVPVYDASARALVITQLNPEKVSFH